MIQWNKVGKRYSCGKDAVFYGLFTVLCPSTLDFFLCFRNNSAEIHTFCTGRFGITFPQFAKIDVNGENAIPLYRWLTENTTFEGFGTSPMALMLSGIVKKMDKEYKNNGKIKWNFTKFLIDREGNIAARFEPMDMKNLRQKVESCL